MSRHLIEAGLDTLWVSLDGIRPESYADVRLGALLPEVLENLRGFKEIRRDLQLARLSPAERERFEAGMRGIHDSWRLPDPSPGIGVAFVAMKRNIGDLSELVAETYKLGARQFVISNVVPYTEELTTEILREDNTFPRCGACLWSHGLIRCP
jgi:MoaA/NifB/PqqE/SkfB family radical SAM enzyme